MLYSEWITNMRNLVGDTRRRVHVDWIGDGATTVFQAPDDTWPILDQTGTYVIKVAGSTKTETTDYTLDKQTGTLTLNSAPTNGQAVTMDSSAVYMTDADWIVAFNNIIRSLGDGYFKEFVDTSSLVAVVGALSYSLVAGIPNCIAVHEFSRRLLTTDNWTPVENDCNWRYDRENNTIYIGDNAIFPSAGEYLKVRGIKTYTLGTIASSTIDVQDRYMTLFEIGGSAKYYRYRYKSAIELVSKLSTENTRTPLQELMMLADRFDRLFEAERAKLKPSKPPRQIPVLKQGSPRP